MSDLTGLEWRADDEPIDTDLDAWTQEPLYTTQAALDYLSRNSKGQFSLEFLTDCLGLDVRIIEPRPQRSGKSLYLEMWNEQQRKVASKPRIPSIRGFSYSVDQTYIDETYLPVDSRESEVGDPEGLSTLRRMGFRPEALCCRLARVGW